jgi:hypothetical protein
MIRVEGIPKIECFSWRITRKQNKHAFSRFFPVVGGLPRQSFNP